MWSQMRAWGTVLLSPRLDVFYLSVWGWMRMGPAFP